jgi:hypothetical protein
MAETPSEKLKKLEQRKARIERQLRAEKAKTAKRARAHDTRRKIIVGASILAAADADESARRVISKIVAGLRRPADRAAWIGTEYEQYLRPLETETETEAETNNGGDSER